VKRENILVGVGVVGLAFVMHILPEVDKTIFYQINHLHFHWLDTVMLPITYCGDGTVLFLVSLGVWRLRGFKKFLKLVLILLTCGIFVELIKYFFPSPRPSQVVSDIHILGSLLRARSFPSGHAASTFGLVTFVSEEFPKLQTLSWVIGILVGYSRIYVGAHFPADVLFGIGLGYLVAKTYMAVWQDRIKR